MRAVLTKRLITSVAPQARPYELRDTQVQGLLLRVQPSGHKAWVIEWARGKRRTLGALGHLSLDQARAHAAQAMAEVIQQGLPSIAKPERPRCSLAAFLSDHYEPWARAELRKGERYVQRIRTAFAAALSKMLTEIDAAWVDRWWTERLGQKSRSGRLVTKATASRDLACLRAALSRAVRWGLLDRNPVMDAQPRPVEARKVVRYLSPSEEATLRAVLAARDARLVAARISGNRWRSTCGKPLLSEIPTDVFGDHVTPVVLLAMNTGLRRGELLSLRWDDVNLVAALLTVKAEKAKSGRSRHVPLNVEALRVLTSWRAQNDGDAEVFSVSDVKTAWTSLVVQSGLAGVRFHDLRHHFASKLVMRSVDLNSVRELLGHADLKMTLRYAHLAPAHLASAVARLND